MSNGIPGIGGSLGMCVYCGESFMLEVSGLIATIRECVDASRTHAEAVYAVLNGGGKLTAAQKSRLEDVVGGLAITATKLEVELQQLKRGRE